MEKCGPDVSGLGQGLVVSSELSDEPLDYVQVGGFLAVWWLLAFQ
jgi:hypothetical protein